MACKRILQAASDSRSLAILFFSRLFRDLGSNSHVLVFTCGLRCKTTRELLFAIPERVSSVTKFQNDSGIPLRQLLESFYAERMDLTIDRARDLVCRNEEIELWNRMTFEERFREETRVNYFGAMKPRVTSNTRRNSHVAGEFIDAGAVGEGGSDCSACSEPSGTKLLYYGKVRKCIKCS